MTASEMRNTNCRSLESHLRSSCHLQAAYMSLKFRCVSPNPSEIICEYETIGKGSALTWVTRWNPVILSAIIKKIMKYEQTLHTFTKQSLCHDATKALSQTSSSRSTRNKMTICYSSLK